MTETYKINQVPSITWNWLRANSDTVQLPDDFSEYSAKAENLPSGVTVKSSADYPEFIKTSGTFNLSTPKSIDKRAPDAISTSQPPVSNSLKFHPLAELSDNMAKNPLILEINGKPENPVIINLNFSKNSITKQLIVAKENSEASVIINIKGDASASILQTQILCEPYSKIHVYKVQLMDKSSLLLDDTVFNCLDNSTAYFTQLELGGQHVDSGLHASLSGYQSKINTNVAYICQNEQYFDFNHIVYHYGKKTDCKMTINGTLKDKATKVYRGTIDFKKGCSGSKGNEMEESLVLSPVAVNKSLPTILCDEEDVEGEHGATIGRLSQDILFYMQTRGIGEEEAEKLISQAKLQAVNDIIPDEAVRSEVNQWIYSNI